VPEWLNGAVSKTVGRRKAARGFESHPLRLIQLARSAAVLLAALAVFGVWLGLEQSVQVGVGFLYVFPIGMAGWWFGWRGSVAAIVVCTGLFLLGAALDPIDQPAVMLAVRLPAFVAVGVIACLLRTRLIGLEHSAEELEAIRAALAPASLPDIEGLEIGAAFVPSELGVSGDFYLITRGPDGCTVAVVGDVVGHGPRAAQLATFVRARLAAFAANTGDPVELLRLANRAMRESPRRDAFASAVCLCVSADASRLAWAVAGHPLPLRLPSLEPLGPAGRTILLGVRPELTLAAAEIPIDSGEGVLVYTDGATEVRRGRGARLGDEGLRSLLEPQAGLSPPALVAAAQAGVLDWAEGPIRDDLCVVALRSAR
jgi:serine phosphatase RsbU (regulator of sigma subunit)